MCYFFYAFLIDVLFFLDTRKTPHNTRMIPTRCEYVKGSPRVNTAITIVNTGPADPRMVVRVAPMRAMASVTMKLGITVQKNDNMKQ